MDPLVPPPVAPAAPSLPSLPVELVQRIIKLALPRVRFATFRERYDTLLPLCLVNKTWGALAEQELYRHIGLTEKTTFAPLLPRDASVARQEQLAGVRSVWDYNSGADLEATLLACPCLTIYAFAANDFSADLPEMQINPERFAALAPNLEELLLDFCSLTPEHLPPLSLPHLRRLTLSWLIYNSRAVKSLLSAIDAPQLDTLMVVLGDKVANEEYEACVQSIGALAPQLKSFGFGSRCGDEMPAATWSSFTSLETLTLDSNSELQSILAALPSPPRSLRLCPRSDNFIDFRDLAITLEQTPSTLQSLKHLRIPPLSNFDPNVHGNMFNRARVAHVHLYRLCADNAIDVQEGNLIGQSDYKGYLGELLDM